MPSLRDSLHFPTYPRTYVRGYHIPSLSGLERGGACHVFAQNSVLTHSLKPAFIVGTLRGAEAPLFHGAAGA
jgi:hypothetical protein